MRKYLLFLPFLFPVAKGAVIFTVLNPVQTARAVCPSNDFGVPPFGNCWWTDGPTQTYAATLQNTGTETFRIDEVLVDCAPPVNWPYAVSSFSYAPIGLQVAPGQTVNFSAFSIRFGPAADAGSGGHVRDLSMTLVQNSPTVVMSNSQTIVYGIAPEPAAFVPMLASVAGAVVWYRRQRSSRC